MIFLPLEIDLLSQAIQDLGNHLEASPQLTETLTDALAEVRQQYHYGATSTAGSSLTLRQHVFHQCAESVLQQEGTTAERRREAVATLATALFSTPLLEDTPPLNVSPPIGECTMVEGAEKPLLLPLQAPRDTPFRDDSREENEKEEQEQQEEEEEEEEEEADWCQFIGRCLSQRLPLIQWYLHYPWAVVRSDGAASLTVAALLIPQAMSYALIAGMPPVTGLYSSIVGMLTYTLLGTSTVLSVGPVAMISLLTAAAMQKVPELAPAHVAAILSLQMALLLLAAFVLRLGFLTAYLPTPVLAGYTSGAALVIAGSQAPHALGLAGKMSRHASLFQQMRELTLHAESIHLLTLQVFLLTALLLLAVVLATRQWPSLQKYPLAALLLVGIMTLTAGLRLDQSGVAIVGAIPPGLPLPLGVTQLPPLMVAPQIWWRLLPASGSMALIGYLESVAVGRRFALQAPLQAVPLQWDPAQELVALSVGNAIGATMGLAPIAGGLSRTAVNAAAGSLSPAASALAAGLILGLLSLLTPLVYFLPMAALAAMVLLAICGLLDLKPLVLALRSHHWRDALLWLLTAGSCIMLGPDWGLLLAIALGLGFLLYALSEETILFDWSVESSPGNHASSASSQNVNVNVNVPLASFRVSHCHFGLAPNLGKALRSHLPVQRTGLILVLDGVERIDTSCWMSLAEVHRWCRDKSLRMRIVLSQSEKVKEFGSRKPKHQSAAYKSHVEMQRCLHLYLPGLQDGSIEIALSHWRSSLEPVMVDEDRIGAVQVERLPSVTTRLGEDSHGHSDLSMRRGYQSIHG